MRCEGCLVPPGNRASDRDVTRPTWAISPQRQETPDVYSQGPRHRSPPGCRSADTQGAIMTTTTTTPGTPPPLRPPRTVLTAAGLTAFAAVALIPWLLTTSPQTNTGPITPTLAVASREQAAPVLGQASGGWNAGTVDAPAAYVMFCEHTPVVCSPTAPHWPVPVTSSSAGLARPCVRRRNATNPNGRMVVAYAAGVVLDHRVRLRLGLR
jgi:hypothetical protein